MEGDEKNKDKNKNRKDDDDNPEQGNYGQQGKEIRRLGTNLPFR